MLVPLSWLKDYVDIDVTPDVLEEKLFSCGFEVEEKYEVGKDIRRSKDMRAYRRHTPSPLQG